MKYKLSKLKKVRTHFLKRVPKNVFETHSAICAKGLKSFHRKKRLGFYSENGTLNIKHFEK